MSKLETNQVDPATGTTLTLGTSGDTITIPSGVTIANSGTATGFGGITGADQWRLTAQITTNTDPISANLERVDDSTFAKIGTGMSVSSGYWTFPSTGLWMVRSDVGVTSNGDDNVRFDVFATTNNSSYDQISYGFAGSDGGGGDATNTTNTTNFVNVADVSNVKVKFGVGSIGTGSSIQGDTNLNFTAFTFIRLGDHIA